MGPDEREAFVSDAEATSGKLSQAQIEDREWSKSKNWHGGPFNLYYSKRDTRPFVPKRGTELGGATPNFARATSVAFVIGLLLFVALIYWLND
jgi:uncharacterized membrane protein